MSMMEITHQKAEKQTWRDLPLDLMVSIMAYLEIKDNIRASVVCKSWHEAAVSVRITNQPPWLMCFSFRDTYEFYDPSNRNKHKMELPKSLAGYKARYSKDGWLLMCTVSSSGFVLFNPFTTDIVVLPDLELWHEYQLVGFSCAPTSSNCVVITINDYDPGHLIIRTWSPGHIKWTSMETDSQFLDVKDNYVVFSNGMFYCLNYNSCLAVFDPSLRTWNVLDVPPPGCPGYDEVCCDGKFMVSYKGDIFVICTFGNSKPLVFKLDLTRGVWEKKENLGSLTIFASINSCEPRTYVGNGMRRNSIYFSKLCNEETHCLTYSFDEERYSPLNHNINWGIEFFYENIWIDPPENALEEIVQKQMENVCL